MVFATACHVITELNCSNIYASQDVDEGAVTSIVRPEEGRGINRGRSTKEIHVIGWTFGIDVSNTLEPLCWGGESTQGTRILFFNPTKGN